VLTKRDADGLRISVEVATAVAGIKRSVQAIDANKYLVMGGQTVSILSGSVRTISALKTQRAFVDGATLLDDLLCKGLVQDVLALAALAPQSEAYLTEVVRATSLAIARVKKAPDEMRGGLGELIQMFQKQYDAGESAKVCLQLEGKNLCIAVTDTIKCYMQGAVDMEVSLKGYLKALQDKLHIIRQLIVYTKDTRMDVDLAEHVASACMHAGMVQKWNTKYAEVKDITMKDVVALSEPELGDMMTGWMEVLKFGRDAARKVLAEACSDAELVDKFFQKVESNTAEAPTFPIAFLPL
jgi:hypothetical protein